MDAILDRMDVFDSFSTLRGAHVLKKLLIAEPKLGERSTTAAAILLEALEFYTDSAYIMSEIFTCLSLFKVQRRMALVLAFGLELGYIRTITGARDTTLPMISDELQAKLHQIAANAIENYDTDITLGRKPDKIMRPALNAMKFFYN